MPHKERILIVLIADMEGGSNSSSVFQLALLTGIVAIIVYMVADKREGSDQCDGGTAAKRHCAASSSCGCGARLLEVNSVFVCTSSGVIYSSKEVWHAWFIDCKVPGGTKALIFSFDFCPLVTCELVICRMRGAARQRDNFESILYLGSTPVMLQQPRQMVGFEHGNSSMLLHVCACPAYSPARLSAIGTISLMTCKPGC